MNCEIKVVLKRELLTRQDFKQAEIYIYNFLARSSQIAPESDFFLGLKVYQILCSWGQENYKTSGSILNSIFYRLKSNDLLKDLTKELLLLLKRIQYSLEKEVHSNIDKKNIDDLERLLLKDRYELTIDGNLLLKCVKIILGNKI